MGGTVVLHRPVKHASGLHDNADLRALSCDPNLMHNAHQFETADSFRDRNVEKPEVEVVSHRIAERVGASTDTRVVRESIIRESILNSDNRLATHRNNFHGILLPHDAWLSARP